MIKTNSKIAKENIKNFILDSVHPADFGYDQYTDLDTTDFEAVRKAIADVLHDEKIKYDNRRNMRQYDYFKEWLQGLPSFLDVDYYYRPTAKTILADILQETEAEADRYTEEQAEETLTRLLYREIF